MRSIVFQRSFFFQKGKMQGCQSIPNKGALRGKGLDESLPKIERSASRTLAVVVKRKLSTALKNDREKTLCELIALHGRRHPHEELNTRSCNVNPFRTAVPFGGQTTQIPSSLSPKRDCSSKRDKGTVGWVLVQDHPLDKQKKVVFSLIWSDL